MVPDLPQGTVWTVPSPRKCKYQVRRLRFLASRAKGLFQNFGVEIAPILPMVAQSILSRGYQIAPDVVRQNFDEVRGSGRLIERVACHPY